MGIVVDATDAAERAAAPEADKRAEGNEVDERAEGGDADERAERSEADERWVLDRPLWDDDAEATSPLRATFVGEGASSCTAVRLRETFSCSRRCRVFLRSHSASQAADFAKRAAVK